MKANRNDMMSRGRQLLAALLPCLFILAACDSSSEPYAESAVDTCDLVVSLTTAKVESTERGRTGEDVRSDSSYDLASFNEESVRNVSLSIVTPDNTVYPLVSKYIRQENGVYEYQAKLSVAAEYVKYDPQSHNYSFTGRLVAMANLPDTPQPHPFEQAPMLLEHIAERGAIPMWGVASVKDLKLEPGKIIKSGAEIEMLRSMPKITFSLSDDLRDTFVISEVTASDAAFELTSLCQPSGAENAGFTSSLDIEGCFNPAPEGSPKGEASMIKGLNTDIVTLYTPERDCTPIHNLPPYFNVKLERIDGTGSPITGKAYMCDYKNGLPDFGSSFGKLVRNHDYKYEISLANLEMVISFKEWVFGGKVHIDLE